MQNLNSLLNKCIKGDRKAQKVLYEKHFGFLMSVCYRYKHNQQDAVALVNQAYYNIITHLNSFDQSKPFLPWIKRIAVNAAIDQLRREKKFSKTTVFLDDDAWEQNEAAEFEEDEDESELVYEDYLNMMDSLDEPTRSIFNLYAIDEFTHQEIAAQLDISERTSKRHLSKAREELKHMIMAKQTLMKGA